MVVVLTFCAAHGDALHKACILHCDISSHNIIVAGNDPSTSRGLLINWDSSKTLEQLIHEETSRERLVRDLLQQLSRQLKCFVGDLGLSLGSSGLPSAQAIPTNRRPRVLFPRPRRVVRKVPRTL